ncbi:hypothetical protein ACVWW6_006052 [Bradyrhizobium sp. USDA 3311]
MRPAPEAFRLTFLLPDGAAALSGFHQPSPEGCALDVRWPLVAIAGPSRKAVFDHAARLLRASCRHLPPTSVSAYLTTPAQPAGRDAWSIAVNADVSFSPTGLDAEFPIPPTGQPPPRRLHLVEGGRGS